MTFVMSVPIPRFQCRGLQMAINKLLSNIFNSIKEINWLRKEINRLSRKGMSNICLKVTIETSSKLRFSGFKKFVTRSVLGSSDSRRYH